MMTDPTTTGYNPSSGYLALVALMQNATSIGMSILMIFLVIKRRTSFPTLICVHYSLAVAFVLIRVVWISSGTVPEWSNNPTSIAGTIVAGAIWIPYFIYADQVKGTFRERLND